MTTYEEVLTGIDSSHVNSGSVYIHYRNKICHTFWSHTMNRLLRPSKDQMNDMTVFMIKTDISLFSVNLAIIIYLIQDN